MTAEEITLMIEVVETVGFAGVFLLLYIRKDRELRNARNDHISDLRSEKVYTAGSRKRDIIDSD